MANEIKRKIIRQGLIDWKLCEWFQPENLKKQTDKQKQKLKKSLLKNGLLKSFQVFEHKGKTKILDGHHTNKALLELESEGVVIPKKLNAEWIEIKNLKEAAKYVLIYNSNYAQIQQDPLNEFIQDLDVSDLIEDVEISDIKIQEDLQEVVGDEVPEYAPKICKLGDLWELGGHRLLCGDCTDEKNVSKLMNEEKADMVFTDPPHDMDFMGIIDIMSIVCNNVKFVLHNDKFLTKLANAYIDRFETYFVHDFIFHIGGGNRFYSQHDLIACFDYKKDVYNSLKDGFSTVIRKMTERQKGTKTLSHRHQKPVYLVSEFIFHFSKIKNIVIDLFLGSGSTLIACEQTNRKCYGIEIDPHYCDVIVQRWVNHTGIHKIKRNGKVFNWPSNKDSSKHID